MVKRVCYYISDHGYGHAARSIAVIRALLNYFPDIHIYVKAFTAYDFLLNSMQDKRVSIIRQRNDVGTVNFTYPFDVMHDESLKLIKSWIAGWPAYIETERDFCKKHDINLIITDVAPQPLEVASQLGIPSVLISNFTWYNIYAPLFSDELKNELALMKNVYAKADTALILPFEQREIEAKKVVPVNLVAKKATNDRAEMRKRLNVNQSDFLIYVGMGFSMPTESISRLRPAENTKLVIPSNVEMSGEGIIKIPLNETEGQDYIAMCDLAVIKSGYTTTAEAMSAEVPLLITRRQGFSDDIAVCSGVVRLGIGKEISNKEFVEGNWLSFDKKELHALKQNYLNLPERFKNSGIPKIMEEMQHLLR